MHFQTDVLESQYHHSLALLYYGRESIAFLHSSNRVSQPSRVDHIESRKLTLIRAHLLSHTGIVNQTVDVSSNQSVSLPLTILSPKALLQALTG